MRITIPETFRLQGRVKRIPFMYAISLWIAGIIDVVGAFGLLVLTPVLEIATRNERLRDDVVSSVAPTLGGGVMTKVFFNAILGPGGLLVLGAISLGLAYYFGSASDAKFESRLPYSELEKTAAAKKRDRIADILLMVLTFVHVWPTAGVAIISIPKLFTSGSDGPELPWWAYPSLVAVLGSYASWGIISAIFMFLRKRWAQFLLFYFYIFTVVVLLTNKPLLGASGIGKLAFVMPLFAIWPLLRHKKLGTSLLESWRGVVVFIAVLWFGVPALINTASASVVGSDGLGIPAEITTLGAALFLGLLIFPEYRAINRDENPAWAELGTSFIVAFPIVNSLLGVVVQTGSVFF